MPDDGNGAQTPPYRWTIFLGFLVAMLEGFDLQVIGVAGPQLRAVLDLSPQQMGWVFSGSLIGLAIGAFVGGWLSDRVGRKTVLLGAVATFGGFTFASAFAADFQSLLLLRFMTGLGIGGAMPNVIAIVAESVPKARVTALVSGMLCGMPLGGVAVSSLARLTLGSSDWRLLFIVGGVLPLVAVLLLAVKLVETHRKRVMPDGAASRSFSKIFGPEYLAATLSLWGVFALTLLQLSLMLNWVPSLVIAKGFTPAEAFTAASVLNIGSIAGAILLGYLCDRIGTRRTMVSVYIAMALTMYMMSLVEELTALLTLSFITGFLVLGAQFALYGVAPRLYPEHVRGAGVGAAVGAGRIGAIAGPLVAGMLMGAGATGDQVLLFTIPLILLAGLIFIAMTLTGPGRTGLTLGAIGRTHATGAAGATAGVNERLLD